MQSNGKLHLLHGGIALFQFCRRPKDSAFDVFCRKLKRKLSFSERPWREPEVARRSRKYSYLDRRSILQRQGMQQMRWLSKRHARQQRKIVARLQKPEMLE